MKHNNAFIAIGLMLFALFFGAGNIIFPPFLGQHAGLDIVPAITGFLITGCGLPLLGVVTVCWAGKNLQDIAGRVYPWYGVFMVAAISLTIGPFFAIPARAPRPLKCPWRPSSARAIRRPSSPIPWSFLCSPGGSR